MEALNAIVSYACRANLLQSIASQQIKHRISFYADDVVLFLRPSSQDISTVVSFLDFFGHATGLQTNISKNSVTPIQCGEDELATIAALLPCEIKSFPCTYLGIPLSIRKPSNADLMPLVDKIADKLPGWKANLLSRAGRLVLVKAVLSSVPIYLMLALELPSGFSRQLTRRGGGSFGRDRGMQMERPLQYGSLGILNLETLGWALRIRWLWLQKTDAARPWAGLPVQIHRNAKALFDVAVVYGESVKFWTDRWLLGKTVAEHCPSLIKLIPKRVLKRRTVAEGLTDRNWVSDIRGALSVQVLVEYLQLWNLVDEMLQPDTDDKHVWRLSRHATYSSKSAYDAFFVGSITFGPWRRVWKTWAPLKCKFFAWLVIKNRVWTADRLAKRGLPHPAVCPLCDQAEETIQHILISCVFARQVWTLILQELSLPAIVLQPGCTRFSNWWCQSIKSVDKNLRKGLNSLILLVAWEIWKHRNKCVFEGVVPCVQQVRRAVVESTVWCLARAAALQDLLRRAVGA
ncbi:hypothetical protein U9M48_042695 [Paspalum notatum var. saurae]|uniref:Reverse transcriptase zinc-binding domain-containing protein n=1 Tax=Paspalum notatum var. saurae TaxID=547442 RepID=A0AAQ3URP3_PASNO